MDTAESNEAKDKNELLYKIGDIPPWYICILLGFQVINNILTQFTKKKRHFFGFYVLKLEKNFNY